MNLISENQILYDISEEHEDLPFARWENYLKRAIRDAMRIIGMRADTNLKSELLQLDESGALAVGDHVLEIRDLLLVTDSGNAIEPAFARSSTQQASSGKFLSVPYRLSDQTQLPVVRFDPAARCLFIENTDRALPDIDHAILSYIGHVTDDMGSLLVPDQASTAIKSYLDWKVKSRKRNRDNNSIPQSEVDTAFQIWKQMAGHARGRISMVQRPRMKSLVTEQWYRKRYQAPHRNAGT